MEAVVTAGVVGPKAALILGVLSKPSTVAELEAVVARDLDDSSWRVLVNVTGASEMDVRLAVLDLRRGGVSAVRGLLERLEEVGLVRRAVGDQAEDALWWRAE